MKNILPKSIEVLIEELSHLPGIGPKSASRLTFGLLSRRDSFIEDLSNALTSLKLNLRQCSRCFIITDLSDTCVVCQDTSRDQKLVCVVETALDVVALEQSGSFNGVYHVLGGAISPLDGIGPNDLHIKELIGRCDKERWQEVILATNPSLEGEATTLYINDMLKDKPVVISRIARGLPIGGSLEYADEVTLQRALEGRQLVKTTKGK